MGGPVGIVGLGGLMIVMLCVVGLVWLWVRVLRRPPAAAPQCGQCGYLVAGLEKMACPECGSDLREVGIATPRSQQMSLWLFLVAWTLLFPVPAMILSAVVMRAVPRTQSTTCTLVVAPVSGTFSNMVLFLEYASRGRPTSVSGSSVQSQSDGVTRSSTITFPSITSVGARLDRAQVRLLGAGGQVVSIAPGSPAAGPVFDLPAGGSMRIDEAALAQYLGRPPQGDGNERTTEDATEFALDVADFKALAEAAVAGKASFATTRLSVVGSTTSSGRVRTPLWAVVCVLAFWTAVYAGGITLYVIARRRKHDA